MVDSEGAALTTFLRMLCIFIKEIKDRAAVQVQLALGFWWDSVNLRLKWFSSCFPRRGSQLARGL